MSRVVHFEIHSADPATAIKFFSDTFGWQFQQWGNEEYWLASTGDPSTPGIGGGLMKSRDGNPRTVNTIAVESVDEYAEKVIANGGQVVVPKMPIPGVGYLAYCTDPTGNIFGIMHNDPNAA